MKKTLKFYPLLAGILVASLAIGCSDDDTPDSIGGISSQDAADLIAEALSEDTGGIKTVLNEFAQISLNELPNANKALPNANRAECGVIENDSDSLSESSGDRTVTASFAYQYLFTCDGLVPVSLTGNAEATIDYTGPNFTSTATYEANGVVTNLVGTSEPYSITGEADYNSSSELNSNTRTFLMNWVLTAVQVDRDTFDFVGGSGTISIEGTGPNGAYEFSGPYTISSDNELLITIGQTEFTIDLDSGIVR
jgi:hypothetical protein